MSMNWLKGMDQHMAEELLWLTLHTARRTWMA